MIKTFKGDALSVKKGIIVHGCNTLGVMGAGIARTVQERYPEAYKVYREQYESRQESIGGRFCGLKLGEITYAQVDTHLPDLKLIVNAVTQANVGTHTRQVDYEAVASCFEKVNLMALALIQQGEVVPIVFPMIGAGLGGGNWNIIEKIIDETIDNRVEKHLYIYTP